jgi:speckle-type POZ protein
VQYNPNGWKSEDKEYYLVLADTVAEAVKTQANISLLDQDGELVPAYSHTINIGHMTDNKCVGFGRFIKRQVLEKSEHLKDDSFTVRLKVTVMMQAIMEQTPLVVVPPCDMHRHFGDLLSSKEGADVKFRVRRTTFHAHRSVLAARSPVLKKGLLGPMKALFVWPLPRRECSPIHRDTPPGGSMLPPQKSRRSFNPLL